DGKTLATMLPNGSIQLWDTTAAKESHAIEQKGTVGIAFTPDSKKLAIRTNNQTIRLCDVATGKEASQLQIQKKEETKPAEQAPAAADKAAEELKRLAERVALLQGGGTGGSSTLAYSSDGKIMATVANEVQNNHASVILQLIDAETGKEF